MRKIKSLYVLACGAIACSTMPFSSVVHANSTKPEYYASGEGHKGKNYDGEFFANGTAIAISAPINPDKSALITWDGGSQEVEIDDMIFAGSNSIGTTTHKANIDLASTQVTMNGGTIRFLAAGNKVNNEETCEKSKVGNAILDINGGEIGALFGNDNQNAAFGNDVAKELNGKSYKNYSIEQLTVTIDGANVHDFRGVTSYTYANKIDVTVGKEAYANLGILVWGTNGYINEGTFTMYSGKTEVGQSNYRATLNNMSYNILGGEVGDIYVGSYYPKEETSNEYWYKNQVAAAVGGIDYGFTNKTSIRIAKGAKYNDILSGFQYRDEEVKLFKSLYPNDLWRINNINISAPVTLNLSAMPSANSLDAYSMIDASNATTNWIASSIQLNNTSKALNIGENFTLQATLDITKAPAVTFTSSNPNVASVDKNGKVTALEKGSATITAASGNVNATCTVTVHGITVDIPDTDPSKPVEDVTPIVPGSIVESISKDLTAMINSILQGDIPNGVNSTTAQNMKDAIQAGKTITPHVSASALNKKDVKDSDNKKMEAILEDNSTIAQYLDFSVSLKADGKTLGNMNEFENALSFSVAIPNNLKKEGRNFYIIRLHNGVAEKLNVTLNDDGTIAFETNKLSTFALVYEDKQDTGSIAPITPDTTTPPATKPSTTTTPTTGDNSNLPLYTIILLGSIAAFAGIVVLKKYKSKKSVS